MGGGSQEGEISGRIKAGIPPQTWEKPVALPSMMPRESKARRSWKVRGEFVSVESSAKLVKLHLLRSTRELEAGY